MAELLDEKVTLYASYRVDSGHLYHMAKVAALLKMPEMLRLVESYLRHMSMSRETALQCLEITFAVSVYSSGKFRCVSQDQGNALVSPETQDFIADVFADQFGECISSFTPSNIQKVKALSVNTLAALLMRNSKRTISREGRSKMSLMRCQAVVFWLRANPAYIMHAQRLFRTVHFEQMSDNERHTVVAWLRRFGYVIFAAAENFLIDAEFEGLKIQQQAIQAPIAQATL
uniref:Uncharacterized protein n=1 Tax=Parascaris univalens TaxID=6257 RepID=A0A914ZX42_PARUN